MIKHRYSKLGLIACMAFLVASVQVRADMASASGALVDIYVAAAAASQTLADASGKGEDAIKAAQERIDVIDKAITQALEAYSKLEAAGGKDAAAEDALRKARQMAVGGDTPASTPEERAGYKLPNPSTVLWQSDGLQKLYKELNDIAQSTSAKGGTEFTETDFTSI